MGMLKAYYPDYEEETIFSANIGDALTGDFCSGEERGSFLTKIAQAINERIGKSK